MLIGANHPLKSAPTQTGLEQLNLQLAKFKLKLGSHPTLGWDRLRVGESLISMLEIEFVVLYLVLFDIMQQPMFSFSMTQLFYKIFSGSCILALLLLCHKWSQHKSVLDWLQLFWFEKWGSLREVEWPCACGEVCNLWFWKCISKKTVFLWYYMLYFSDLWITLWTTMTIKSGDVYEVFQ